MVTNTHYRWDFIGLSTDTKPTPATSEKVVDGSTFYCADNSKLYVYCQNDWYERKALGNGGGGGDSNIPKLTSADYNYDSGSGSNDCIDPLTLDSGVYLLDAETLVYLSEDEGCYHFGIPALIEINNEESGTCIITNFYNGSTNEYTIVDDVGTRTVTPTESLRGYGFDTNTFTFTLVDGTTVEKNIPIVFEED